MEEHGLNERQLIGSRIREARVGRRMSQADLAAKANISLPHVSAIETGKTNMKLESFIRIIEALQVSADSLLGPMCRRCGASTKVSLTSCWPIAPPRNWIPS